MISPGTSLGPTRELGITLTSQLRQMGGVRKAKVSPTLISAEGFTTRPFSVTCSRRMASVARLRVLKRRTHQRNLSRRIRKGKWLLVTKVGG